MAPQIFHRIHTNQTIKVTFHVIKQIYGNKIEQNIHFWKWTRRKKKKKNEKIPKTKKECEEKHVIELKHIYGFRNGSEIARANDIKKKNVTYTLRFMTLFAFD